MKKKPTYFLICKLVGIACLLGTLAGVILITRVFGDFENSYYIVGWFLVAFGMTFGSLFLAIGLKPSFAKARIQLQKYILEENKDDLTSIASDRADITSDAVKTTARAVKEGLCEKKFCKYCGKQIDADARFCSACRKEQ